MMPYRLVFYDFETTGLSIENDQPIEIGAIDDRGRKFHRLIKLERPDGTKIVLPKVITELTGYSERDLEIGVGVEEAFKDFLKWIFEIPGPFFMIAHNGDRFDHLIFKKWTNGKIGKNDNFRMMFLDTYVLAKLKFPGEKSYKLADLGRQIGGLTDIKSHNALDDCMTTIRIFEKLM